MAKRVRSCIISVCEIFKLLSLSRRKLRFTLRYRTRRSGEMVDTSDLKSGAFNSVRVRVPPSAQGILE
jgi:hypothetical protein